MVLKVAGRMELEQHSEFGRKASLVAWFWSMVLAAVYQSVGTMLEGCPEGMVAIAF